MEATATEASQHRTYEKLHKDGPPPHNIEHNGWRTILSNSIWLKVCWQEGTPNIVSLRMETFSRASLFLFLLLSTTAVKVADKYKHSRSGHAAISHGRFMLVVVPYKANSVDNSMRTEYFASSVPVTRRSLFMHIFVKDAFGFESHSPEVKKLRIKRRLQYFFPRRVTNWCKTIGFATPRTQQFS